MATQFRDQSGAHCHHPQRHRLRWWPLSPGGNQSTTIEQRTKAATPTATQSPDQNRAHCHRLHVTGYDGGHCHRAATSQPLSSSAPQAATPTATQSPDQSGAPKAATFTATNTRIRATPAVTDTMVDGGTWWQSGHNRATKINGIGKGVALCETQWQQL